ncbi:hypothetical protein [Dishui Lake large algae virus 1]|nr:hypothetical protein [Dishui Lake large algae virus 1]
MGALKLVLVLFFVLNALFWGLWPHSAHCGLAAAMGITKCVPHIVHITFGLLCFIIAVLIAQWGHFHVSMKA